MKDMAFGQYYPSDSAVHRLDPRTKLLFALFYITAMFFLKTVYGYLAAAVYISVIILISKIPLTTVLKSVKNILFLLIFTAFLNVFFGNTGGEPLLSFWKIVITREGLLFSASMALRLTLLVIGTSMLTYTTTPTALTAAIESLLKPLTWLKINVHDISIIMNIAIRFIPTIQEETEKIISAQKARGADFDTGNIFKRARAMIPILIPLFISSFRRADELSLALEARCYNLTDKRTRMKELRFRLIDIGAPAFGMIFVGLIILERMFLV